MYAFFVFPHKLYHIYNNNNNINIAFISWFIDVKPLPNTITQLNNSLSSELISFIPDFTLSTHFPKYRPSAVVSTPSKISVCVFLPTGDHQSCPSPQTSLTLLQENLLPVFCCVCIKCVPPVLRPLHI